MQRVLAADGYAVPVAGRVLDFGCAAGRMLRWWPDTLTEAWGVDIQIPHIEWARSVEAPPFRFARTSVTAGLPFPSEHFDLVYAGSVFTHIPDGGTAWARELARVTRRGGRLYITVHDERTAEILRAKPEHWVTQYVARERGSVPSEFVFFAVGGDEPKSAVAFHGRRFIRREWGEFLRQRSVTPEAYCYQTAYLFQPA